MTAALIILAALALLCAIERIYEAGERKLAAPGKFVETHGRKMHIVELDGDGKCIVMLPGMGTDVPCADFLPLAKGLNAEGFRVLMVEPFGYGFSDGTDAPRDVERVAEELRDALRAFGVQRDYILFGHSASGLTMRAWAAKYPDEVAGIIGEDISLPEQFDQPELTWMLVTNPWMAALFALSRFLGRLGVNRIFALRAKALKRAAGENRDRLRSYRAAFVRSRRSKVLRAEHRAIVGNGARVAGMPLPKCPMLLLTACGRGSCEIFHCKSGFSWVSAHRALAAQVERGKCVEIPGPHYLHYQHAAEIQREVASCFGEK